MALLLHGDLVTFDPERPFVAGGTLAMGDDGRIAAVLAAGEAPPAGLAGAPALRTRGVIYPGLIDLHNHLAYNCRSLWIPPRTEPYTRRDQWPREDSYAPEIRHPAAALGQLAGKAVLKLVETKALVGGCTAIQGSAKLDRPYEGWLVRNVELETFGTGEKTVNQSVRTLGEGDFADVRRRMGDGNAFLYHLAEGTDDGLLGEFAALASHECLRPQLVAIHATALDRPQYDAWAPTGGSVVWSPFSNLWLYGDTTDIRAVVAAGLRLCLGADWAPSGSKSVLGELKVADIWNRRAPGEPLSDEALCAAVTANPADALGWGDRIGRLRAGLHADVFVCARRAADPYRNLIAATEGDVRLVLVDGRPLYGLPSLMTAAGADGAERIAVAGRRRAIVLRDPANGDADLRWPEVLARLEAVRRDPAGAARAPALHRGEEPVRVELDMPWDEAALTRAPLDLETVVIPPIDTLAPDRRFFADIDRAPIHGGVLGGLRAYYA